MNELVTELLLYETNPDNPPDGRRVIRDERLRVQTLRNMIRSDRTVAKRLAEAETEARRVLGVWTRPG